MPQTINCDLVVAGGGLAGGLIALALAARRPDLDVRLIEQAGALGGNHIWSFFGPDVGEEGRALIAPLVSYGWRGYDVAFPRHARTLGTPYYSIESERLDTAVRAALPAERIVTGARILTASARAAVLEDGTRYEGKGLIDARGPATLRPLDLAWQKFVGHELKLERPHGLERPIVMDATVEQHDGYRFVYCLPFDDTTVFVEDTYYSEFPPLLVDQVAARIQRYAEGKGWAVREIGRRETGVLPVAMGGDFEAYWQAGGAGVAKAGVRAGLFHPTTGYSLPDAVATALKVAGMPDLSAPVLHDELHAFASGKWRERGFYRLLDRMLFRAGAAQDRYKVLERFYTLDEALVTRFYASRSTRGDQLRVLVGKPPVPFFAALGQLREGRA